MKPLVKNISVLCVLLCVLYSCRVEKRVYRKGYHVVWNHKKTERTKTSSQVENTHLDSRLEEVPEVVVVASNSKPEKIVSTEIHARDLALGKDTCGDVIYLKNGEKINVKVLEVDRGVIKYKRCDNLDGPLFSIRKSSLAMLQYYNGVKEDLEFEAESVPYSESKKFEQKKQNPMGLAAFICALGGFFLFFPFFLAMPFALISLNQFKREPNKYSDKWMPRAALIISAVVYLLAALIAGIVAAFSFDMVASIVAIIALVLGIICVIPLSSAN